MVVVFTQANLFMAFFFGLQAMALKLPAFTTGGVGWFTDLAAQDPYLVRSPATLTLTLTQTQTHRCCTRG